MDNLRKSIFYLQEAIRHDYPNSQSLLNALDVLSEAETLVNTKQSKQLCECTINGSRTVKEQKENKCMDCNKQIYPF